VTESESDAVAAVVVAAGGGQRFGGEKLFVPLGGRPILDWSLRAMEESAPVASIVVVLSEANRARGERLVHRRGYRKVRGTARGGARRQDSVWNGLKLAAGHGWVLIHDAARPFVTCDIVARCVAAARNVGGAIAAVPVKDKIKVAGSERLIAATPARETLWAAQTPQVFRYDRLIAAYEQNQGRDATDDAELFERAGWPVALVMGAYENVKITTPEDLLLGRALARRALDLSQVGR
jgi:2-C-methyl-D-erythritol 4-phosphate cytidylyltransferase